MREYVWWYKSGAMSGINIREPGIITSPTGNITAEYHITWHENGALNTCISFEETTIKGKTYKCGNEFAYEYSWDQDGKFLGGKKLVVGH
jgi:hypothetical protein